jgi:cytoskeletal protein CcmA (bactofilin family)
MTYGLLGEFSGLPQGGALGIVRARRTNIRTNPPGELRERMKPAEGSTVIGKSVTIKGELSGNEDLYMDGNIEGTITLSDHGLTIGPNAHVLADIKVRDVTVFGKVTGNLHATGRVDLRHSAVVSGDIYGGRLSIEENAMVKGRVELKAPDQKQASAAQASAAKVEQESLVLEPKA